MAKARLRMFAGPNGSGKSSLKKYLSPPLLGVYLNPDDIESQIRQDGFFEIATYQLGGLEDDAAACLTSPEIRGRTGEIGLENVAASTGRLEFNGVEINSYAASVLVGFLREKLMERKVSFTIETVMSHPSKVDLLAHAQAKGYRTYLYYIATEDPDINVSRVENRVRLGGHDVPEEKIVARYYRSLDLLPRAIAHTNRAYIFDNSSEDTDHTWLAEITDGETLELKQTLVPAWFNKAVLGHYSDPPMK